MSVNQSSKIAKMVWDMSDPDMVEDFRRCMKAMDLCGAIFEFQEYLQFKHIDKNPTPDEIRTKFYEILEERGIIMEDLYS